MARSAVAVLGCYRLRQRKRQLLHTSTSGCSGSGSPPPHIRPSQAGHCCTPAPDQTAVSQVQQARLTHTSRQRRHSLRQAWPVGGARPTTVRRLRTGREKGLSYRSQPRCRPLFQGPRGGCKHSATATSSRALPRESATICLLRQAKAHQQPAYSPDFPSEGYCTRPSETSPTRTQLQGTRGGTMHGGWGAPP